MGGATPVFSIAIGLLPLLVVGTILFAVDAVVGVLGVEVFPVIIDFIIIMFPLVGVVIPDMGVVGVLVVEGTAFIRTGVPPSLAVVYWSCS